MANFQQVSDSSSHMNENGGVHGAEDGGRWYFSRREIEEDSPSRRDGIDLKKETYLRKSYCTFLQDLGMRLKVPQLTIATAIIFCHRFFLRQSHAKNDRRTIATVCMFLAGKVEETPRPLKDVILISYEIINKKDPEAVQRIKQKEVYEQQKELILIGERVVLATLAFDLNVHHPYKPLVEAIKKFKVAQNALAQVAWNFVNDGLRTSLCLQFKPHHIAAGAIFLAAKFLKVKLPSDGDKVWWQEFDVTPRQLEDVSNQMLELYEQNRVPPATNSEAEGTNVAGASNRPTSKASSGNEDRVNANSHSQMSVAASKPGVSKPRPGHEQTFTEGAPRTTKHQGNEGASVEMGVVSNKNVDDQAQDNRHKETEKLPPVENVGGAHGEDWERNTARTEKREAGESKDKQVSQNLEHKEGTSLGQPPRDSVIKIDRDKLKAKREKQKKSRGDITRKTDTLDEDDLIERELENGIELAAESEKNKQVRRPSAKPVYEKYQDDSINGQLRQGLKFNNMEEGEVPDDMEWLQKSPNDSVHPDDTAWMRKSPKYGDHYHLDDHSGMNQLGYMERDHKRHVPENHV